MSIPLRPFAVLASLAITGSALAGCAQQGTAVVVDGHPISEQAISELSIELPGITGGAGSVSAAAEFAVLAESILVAAGEHGIVVSETETRQALEQAGVDPATLSEATLRGLGATLVQQKVQMSEDATEIFERANALVSSAEVSPRYGLDFGADGVADLPPWLIGAEGAN
ncbi:MAG: hypothetical protein Q4P36_06470 [Bowdeniella nasicola]|nr:hypothetical protein [Bowdeniella nasicola]